MIFIQNHSNELKKYIVEFWKQVKNLFNIYSNKQLITLFKWLNYFIEKLNYEHTYEPGKLPSFKRGDIVWVNLGYNIGSELGGSRPVVILEAENNKKDKNIVIAPIRSYNSKGPKKIFEGLVYVGKHETLTEHSYVDLKHIRSISKMRIYRNNNKIIQGRLPNEILDEIDQKLIKLFTKTNT